MSFRGRLTLFFVAIVVVPMIAVAVLVVEVTADSANGKADARLATGLATAQEIYDEALHRAPKEVNKLAETPGVTTAMSAPNASYLDKVAGDARAEPGVVAVSFYDADGKLLAHAGPNDALARSRRPLRSGTGRIGEIEVAALGATAYVQRVHRLTGVGASVVADRGPLASTVRLGGAELPSGSGGVTVDLQDNTVRAAALALDGAPPGARLVLTTDAGEGFVARAPTVALVLIAFFGLASVFVFLLLRMLSGQVSAMLSAARRIGDGDFSGEVPVEGDDELAGLAREFNRMSGRLSDQMKQLQHQREELDQSVRRIGEAFAAGLDRSALLEIVIETALAAAEAEAGVILLAGHDEPEASAGEGSDSRRAELLRETARRSMREGRLVEGADGKLHAIAHPLIRAGEEVSGGAMAIARKGRAFDDNEKEVLRYLIGQASVSVENIGLHERVAEQAVTDELTGLSNNRHFREWIELETQRLARFGGELSLVLLDIDNFKRVNDTYGHLQGDQVLRTLGRVLQLESRGVDEAARYGGEEFVLALPETPRPGALEVAERVRERIEATEVAGVDGNSPLHVTASIGVATMPADGADPRALIAAADAALYEAKRSGKNRVVAAGAS